MTRSHGRRSRFVSIVPLHISVEMQGPLILARSDRKHRAKLAVTQKQPMMRFA
jgi:hypothetical protein